MGISPRFSRKWGDSAPGEFPILPGETRYFPISGRPAAAPGDLPGERAARAGGNLLLLTPPTALPSDVRGVVVGFPLGAIGGFAETSGCHILALPRRDFAANAAHRVSRSVSRPLVVSPKYGICQTRLAMYIPDMARAPIRNSLNLHR